MTQHTSSTRESVQGEVLPTGPLRERRPRTWAQKHGRAAVVWALRVAVLLAFLGIWQLLSGPVLNPMYFSDPLAVANQLGDWITEGTLIVHTWITVQEVFIGYAIGVVAGALAGYLLAAIRLIYDVVEPFMMALYAIPNVALAPLFIVWFGIGMDMKIILAAVTVFFLVFLNVSAAVQGVDRGLIDAVRLMGGKNSDVAFRVVLPASMGGLMTGLQVSIPFALIGAVIGELVASNQGLGYLVNDSAAQFNTAGVFAAVAVLAVLALILKYVVGLVFARMNRWDAA